MTRPYGHLPPEVHKYMVRWYDTLADDPSYRGSPYRVLAKMFGVTEKRIQQVVIEQRKKAKLRAESPSSH